MSTSWQDSPEHEDFLDRWVEKKSWIKLILFACIVDAVIFWMFWMATIIDSNQ
jgi:hypothetical protein